MKIMIVSTFYDPNRPGGAARSVQLLAEQLVRMGEDVVVASISGNQEDNVATVNGVKVHYIEAAHLGKSILDDSRSLVDRVMWHLSAEVNPNPTRRLSELLDAERPDVVHTNVLQGFSTGILKMIRRKAYPVVHTLRDYYLLCPRSTMFRNNENCNKQCLDCRLFTYRRRYNSHAVTAVVGMSNFVLNRHYALGYFKNISRNGTIFSSWERDDTKETEQVPTATRKLRVGFIGRIHPTKGIESAIESVLSVSQDRCELLIAGSGRYGYELSLKQRFNQDNVRFLGWTDPSEFFESIDLLLVPSVWHEPLPRTVVEAAAYGVPVLASARGGISEIVDEGENGWLYDPDEERALPRKLKQLIAEPQRIYELRESCKRKAREFSHKRMALNYMKIYQSAMRHVDPDFPDGSANT